MLTLVQPAEAYRRIELDARVAGANGCELVLLCFERFDLALGTALAAADRADNAARSAALTSAFAALTALELGIDRGQPVAAALHQLYASARKVILDAVLRMDGPALKQVRADFCEVGAALRGP
jgi:flagellin-specific chaperone FliS